MICAFCAGARTGSYIEFEVTVPDAEGRQRQLFGAHAQCMTDAMSEGFEVDLELLIDRHSELEG